MTTSATYQRLIALADSYFVHSVDIGDQNYGEDDLISLNISSSIIGEELSIGNAIAAEIELSMLMPDDDIIPRMARIVPYTQLRTATEVAPDVITHGVFFIDTRSVTHNSDGLDILTLHGYDAMLKAERELPQLPLMDSYGDKYLIQQIATTMGVSLHPDALGMIDKGYSFPLPTGYTMREILGFIGSAYGGNWIFDGQGRLKFVPLTSGMPDYYVIATNNNVPIAATVSGEEVEMLVI